MAINGVNSYSTKMRLTGLGSSGLDTDSIVSQLMKVERMPLDKLSQKRQLAVWKQDAYRDISAKLKTFQSDFFDVLKPTSNMRSQSIYQKYTTNTSDPSTVTATGGVGITNTSHKIVVNEIAQASTAASSGNVSKAMVGSNVAAFNVNDYNNTFNLTVNGTTKTIKLQNGNYADTAAIIGNGTDDNKLAYLVKQAFSNVDVVANGSGIEFRSTGGVGASDSITVTTDTSSVDNLLSVLNVNSSGTGSSITFPTNIAQGRKFSLSIVEGTTTTTKEIEWTTDKIYNDSTTLAADVQSMIDTAFGANKVTVDGTGDKLTFNKGAGVDTIVLSNSLKNDKVVANLGFTTGDSNKLSLGDTMAKVNTKLAAGSFTFNAVDGKNQLTLTINGKDVTVYDTDTLSTFMSKVNSSEAGVTISYNSFSDKFSIINKQTGEGKIGLSDNGSNLFSAIKIDTSDTSADIKAGANASFKLDGIDGTRTSNTFTVDGVAYTLLKKDPGVEKTISLTQDSDTVFNSIKSFVEKYNEIISTINDKMSEKHDRDYLPLTDEQKDAMSEDDIKKWEEKVKTGLLRNDSLLSGIVNNMRRAFSDSVANISGDLSTIGIKTGNYEDKGKLIIDETKLKDAIKNNPDKVMDLFSKESSVRYSPNMTAAERDTRYKENGIANRLYDVLQDNIRTSRDKYNNKGALLVKAGIAGDITEFDNQIYDEIDEYDQKMKDLSSRISEKEDRYYARFSALEVAITKMQSQATSLVSKLGG